MRVLFVRRDAICDISYVAYCIASCLLLEDSGLQGTNWVINKSTVIPVITSVLDDEDF